MVTIIPHDLGNSFADELRKFLTEREGDVRGIYSDDKGIPTWGSVSHYSERKPGHERKPGQI